MKIQDNFVSYEIALLLKEKGFDEECLAAYIPKSKGIFILQGCGALYFDVDGLHINSGFHHSEVAVPLYQQVVDWFRDKHKILIGVRSMAFGYYGVHDNTIEPETWDKDKRWDSPTFKDYYQALNQAITEALKLI